MPPFWLPSLASPSPTARRPTRSAAGPTRSTSSSSRIGNPGNAADTTGNPNPAGSVPYTYRMGKFEISEQMIDKANAAGWTRHHERHPRRRQAGHFGELERGGPVRELAQHEHRQHAGL